MKTSFLLFVSEICWRAILPQQIKNSKGLENMVDDKLRNEDTTRRCSKDEDDRVAADHHQHLKDLKLLNKSFTSITQGGAYVKGELVNTLPT
ncbi:hypothetical protein HanIR_Chr02g0092001 [Helianthus annuus]|nr:hypothetical protein HanIR_Chr02g0092001 [Helianthus annuus]KAJ0619718.1 hypothetical protein HanHA89_Chr02g0074411 [Helianthus annuus]